MVTWARKSNANIRCCLTLASGLSNMLFCYTKSNVLFLTINIFFIRWPIRKWWNYNNWSDSKCLLSTNIWASQVWCQRTTAGRVNMVDGTKACDNAALTWFSVGDWLFILLHLSSCPSEGVLKFHQGVAAIQPDPSVRVWDGSLPPRVFLPGGGQETRGTGTRYSFSTASTCC